MSDAILQEGGRAFSDNINAIINSVGNMAAAAPGFIMEATEGAVKSASDGLSFLGNAVAASTSPRPDEPAPSSQYAGLDISDCLGGFKCMSMDVHDIAGAHEFHHGVGLDVSAKSNELGRF